MSSAQAGCSTERTIFYCTMSFCGQREQPVGCIKNNWGTVTVLGKTPRRTSAISRLKSQKWGERSLDGKTAVPRQTTGESQVIISLSVKDTLYTQVEAPVALESAAGSTESGRLH